MMIKDFYSKQLLISRRGNDDYGKMKEIAEKEKNKRVDIEKKMQMMADELR